MSRKPTYKFWIEFIKLYESQPCLWNSKLAIFKSRKDRQVACMILLRKLRETDAEADIHTVKQKINSFRARYIKRKRTLQSASRADVSVGEWVYYKHLSFLDECLDPLEEEEDNDAEDNVEDSDAETNDSSMKVKTEAWHSTAINTEEINRDLSSPVDTPKLQELAVHQEFWIEFIKLYESKPELWKSSYEGYKDRILKQNSIEELVEKLREIEPNANSDLVKRKIGSFRNIYRREIRKKEEALKLGKPEPVINWLYFDCFSFLQNKNSSDDDYVLNVDKNCDEEKYESLSEDIVEEKYAITPALQSTVFNYEETPIDPIQEFWVEFIELYRSKPELWNVGSDEYRDRELRNCAYNELAQKLREVEPNADVALAKKKIINFRYMFKRALRKKEQALRLGKPEPVINWFYFNYLSFLQNKNPMDDDYSSYEDGHIMEEDKNWDHGLTAKQEFWIEFIELYKSKPELWKRDSKVFKHHEKKKQEAFKELLEKARELYPNADAEMVRRKINGFRFMYKRALHNKQQAPRLGKRRRSVNWCYFDHLSFLQDKEEDDYNPNEDNHIITVDKNCVEEDDYNSNEDNHIIKVDKNCVEGDDYNSNEDNHIIKVDKKCVEDTIQNNVEGIDTVDYSMSPEENSQRSLRARKSPTPLQSPKRLRTKSGDITHTHIQPPSDEANILGIGWAYQYRHLSENQKLFAKKAIDDILFEARLGTLNRNSVKINASKCEKCSRKLKVNS